MSRRMGPTMTSQVADKIRLLMFIAAIIGLAALLGAGPSLWAAH